MSYLAMTAEGAGTTRRRAARGNQCFSRCIVAGSVAIRAWCTVPAPHVLHHPPRRQPGNGRRGLSVQHQNAHSDRAHDVPWMYRCMYSKSPGTGTVLMMYCTAGLPTYNRTYHTKLHRTPPRRHQDPPLMPQPAATYSTVPVREPVRQRPNAPQPTDRRGMPQPQRRPPPVH